jgi:hypothetical protein
MLGGFQGPQVDEPGIHAWLHDGAGCFASMLASHHAEPESSDLTQRPAMDGVLVNKGPLSAAEHRRAARVLAP